MVRESPRSAQAGCAETNFLMKNLSTPCDKTGRVPLVLPLLRLSIFSIDGDFRLSSRAELAFFASGVEGSTRSDFFLPARFQAHRFALIPPRVRFGSRLAHLVGMTKSAGEKIDSLDRGEVRWRLSSIFRQIAESKRGAEGLSPQPARGG